MRANKLTAYLRGHAWGAMVDTGGSLWGCGGGRGGLGVTAGAPGLARGGALGQGVALVGAGAGVRGALGLAAGLEVGRALLHLQELTLISVELTGIKSLILGPPEMIQIFVNFTCCGGMPGWGCCCPCCCACCCCCCCACCACCACCWACCCCCPIMACCCCCICCIIWGVMNRCKISKSAGFLLKF